MELALSDEADDILGLVHGFLGDLRGAARLVNMETNGLPTRWPDDAEGLYDLRGVRAGLDDVPVVLVERHEDDGYLDVALAFGRCARGCRAGCL